MINFISAFTLTLKFMTDLELKNKYEVTAIADVICVSVYF